MFLSLSLYHRGNKPNQCFHYQYHCYHCCSEQDITNSCHDLSTQHNPFRPWGLHQPVHCGPNHHSNSTFLHWHHCQCNFCPVYPNNLGHLFPCIWLCGMLLLGRLQTEIQDITTHTQRRHLFNPRASKPHVFSVLTAIPVALYQPLILYLICYIILLPITHVYREYKHQSIHPYLI